MIHAKKLILVERELLCFLLCLSVSLIPDRLLRCVGDVGDIEEYFEMGGRVIKGFSGSFGFTVLL